MKKYSKPLILTLAIALITTALAGPTKTIQTPSGEITCCGDKSYTNDPKSVEISVDIGKYTGPLKAFFEAAKQGAITVTPGTLKGSGKINYENDCCTVDNFGTPSHLVIRKITAEGKLSGSIGSIKWEPNIISIFSPAAATALSKSGIAELKGLIEVGINNVDASIKFKDECPATADVIINMNFAGNITGGATLSAVGDILNASATLTGELSAPGQYVIRSKTKESGIGSPTATIKGAYSVTVKKGIASFTVISGEGQFYP